MSYEQSIWEQAVLNAECEVMRYLPTMVGGRKGGESLEKYAKRCQDCLTEAFANLKIARDRLNALKGKKT